MSHTRRHHQTHECIGTRQQADRRQQADSKTASRHTRHKRQQADIQDTRRQHQTHECIGTRQTQEEPIQDKAASRHTRHKKNHYSKQDKAASRHTRQGSKQTYRHNTRQQAYIQDKAASRHTDTRQGSTQTYKTLEEPLQIQEYIGAYKTQEDKTDTIRQQHTQECIWGNNRQHKHCNKIAYIDVHACKQTYMFTSCP